jgi:hypothetical protein
MTTRAVGLPQNTKIRANSATALIRSARRCAYVHSPTGPVLTPACSPLRRLQFKPETMAARVRTAITCVYSSADCLLL